jgi:hypothetical protein
LYGASKTSAYTGKDVGKRLYGSKGSLLHREVFVTIGTNASFNVAVNLYLFVSLVLTLQSNTVLKAVQHSKKTTEPGGSNEPGGSGGGPFWTREQWQRT